MKIDWIKNWFKSSTLRKEFGEGGEGDLVAIDIDMMLKGNYFDRPSGKVRQCAVTIDGSTRLVTSGDRVDRETYLALLEVKAIKPVPETSKSS